NVYAGEPRKFDPTFKGPIYNRGCTDILCCILFILALLGYFAVGILAWSQGDPRKVIYPTDSKGQFCGQVGSPLEKKPLLFYFNIMKCASPLVLLEFQCPTTQICVERCPNKFMTLVKALKNEEDREYYKQFCKEGVDMIRNAPEILKDGLCPSILTPSKNFTRRCLPALETLKGGVVVVGNKTAFTDDSGQNINATDLLEASKKSNVVVEARAVAMRIFEDYTQSWHWILLCLVIAVVLSLIFIVLLRFLAGVMVWVMILMVIIVVACGIAYCSIKYVNLKDTPGSNITLQQLGFQPDFSVYLHIRQTWLAFKPVRNHLKCTSGTLKTTLSDTPGSNITLQQLGFQPDFSVYLHIRQTWLAFIVFVFFSFRAVGYVMSSLFYPIFTFFLLTIVIAYWGITAVFLSTSSEPVYKVFNETVCSHARQTCNPENYTLSAMKTDCPQSECLFAFYGGETPYHKYLILLQFYNVFLFFWCANFVTALGQMTLAGAFASYYWAPNKPGDMPAFPLCSSLGRSLRYHTGSLAFGSLILAIVQVIRVLLEYIDHKLKGAENKFAKFLLCCLKCCFWCLEKCIKFINRNAYIMVAIYGKNFCRSARDAFFLLMRNVIRVVVLDKVTDFILFLGKLLIVGLVGIFAFFFFSGQTDAFKGAAPSLHYYWVPILVSDYK
ncbi:choline transporter-like protein 2, partial [Puntigrus tetrazona]|uniref:choline transporter-like protein 2 n=1 Tax=Puntigrus tetrazona TaxID=1606681 RepID=UPI001C892555